MLAQGQSSSAKRGGLAADVSSGLIFLINKKEKNKNTTWRGERERDLELLLPGSGIERRRLGMGSGAWSSVGRPAACPPLQASPGCMFLKCTEQEPCFSPRAIRMKPLSKVWALQHWLPPALLPQPAPLAKPTAGSGLGLGLSLWALLPRTVASPPCPPDQRLSPCRCPGASALGPASENALPAICHGLGRLDLGLVYKERGCACRREW